MRKSVIEWLEAAVEKHPCKTAFIDYEKEVTYQKVWADAKAIGYAIAQAVPPNHAVVILTGRSAYTPICYLGVLYAGCYYVPLDVNAPAAWIKQILSLIDPRVIMTDTANISKVTSLDYSGCVLIAENISGSAIDESVLQTIRQKVIETDPMYVIFTSGSTGLSKGVVTSHRAMAAFIEGYADVLGFNETDILGGQAPLDYVGAIKDIYTALYTGAALLIIPTAHFVATSELFALLNKHKVTSIAWTVTALCILASQNAFDECELPKYLRRVCFTGSVMPCRYLRIWQEHLPGVMFANLYGPTELTGNCSCYVVPEKVRDSDTLPIGKPLPNYRMFVLRADGSETDDSEMGELYVGGPGVSLGYFGDAGRTGAVFLQNPLHGIYRDILFKTGDLCTRRPDGVYEFHGRQDRMVKLHGYRVELDEIEIAAKTIDELEDCCCLYQQETEQLWLFYCGTASVPDIVRILRTRLPAYMIPRKLKQLPAIPRLANMKTDMRKLREMVSEGN